jgi:hypothetical protein
MPERHIHRAVVVTIALALTTAMAPSAVAAPSTATPSQVVFERCDPSDAQFTVTRGDPRLITRYRSPIPLYNDTQDPITRYKSASVTRTHTESHHWEAGGEAGFELGPFKAAASGKYGRATTEGVSQGYSEGSTMTIRVHYTGWWQINILKRKYTIVRYHRTPTCTRVTDAKLAWFDRSVLGLAKTVRGRVDY